MHEQLTQDKENVGYKDVTLIKMDFYLQFLHCLKNYE